MRACAHLQWAADRLAKTNAEAVAADARKAADDAHAAKAAAEAHAAATKSAAAADVERARASASSGQVAHRLEVEAAAAARLALVRVCVPFPRVGCTSVSCHRGPLPHSFRNTPALLQPHTALVIC